MRKFLIGVLLAATAASPALADKDGKGGGKHGGGGKHAAAPHHGGGGGGKHAGRGGGDRGPQAMRVERQRYVQDRGDWQRPQRFAQPVRVVRYDDDKHSRKAWKQAAKQDRRRVKDEAKFVRAVSRERYQPVERWVAPSRYYERPVQYAPVRYAAPVHYVQNDWWGDRDGWNNRATPISYGAYDNEYAGWPQNYATPSSSSGSGLLGGGNGLLSALLPVLLQSVLGGGSSLGGLGGLGGLGSPNVLPLDQVGYADPYSYDGAADISSLLSGSGGLF